MKRLTIKQVASANIRVNRKAYTSLFLGILLAVYLATATSLIAWGTICGHEEQMAQLVGWMDMILIGDHGVTDDQLRETGYFNEIGHVTVNAVAAEVPEICTGWYDETAEKLMNRRMTEGRMPEKAGEIAAERSALDRLKLEGIRVGDKLTLEMRPIYGVEEQKEFTLVGILNEQNGNLRLNEYEEGMQLPAMLVSPDDTYTVGSAVVHRVMTYAPLITLNQVKRHLSGLLGDYGYYGVSRENGETTFYDSGWERAQKTVNRIVIWLVLGAALLLSACIAITSAMETLLSRKTEDIGMLRAIGATRRQIRRVYGSEAWLLAATALPAGVAGGILTAWIVARFSSGQVTFSLNIWLLLPVLALSALCVFIASRLPLFRASRQMPMGVLRDTSLLRRAGKLRNHKEFSPGNLIAGRRTRLHPLRQAGAACMIVLTLSSTLLLGELALGLYDRGERALPAFQLDSTVYMSSGEAFSEVIVTDRMTRSDIRRIESIPGVKQVRCATAIKGNLLMNELPEYFRPRKIYSEDRNGIIQPRVSTLGGNTGEADWLFYTAEDVADAAARRFRDGNAETAIMTIAQRNLLRNRLGTTEEIVPIMVYVADLDPAALEEYVTDGTIDPDRLDSGEEVLVYAPTACGRKTLNGGIEFDNWLDPREIRDDEWDVVIRNDVFRPGMPLKLLEIAGTEESRPVNSMSAGSGWKEYYQAAEYVQTDAKIGAVLSGPVHFNNYLISGFTVFVSPKGAEAMGLKLPGPDFANVYLSGDPSAAAEAEMNNQIQQIALRTQTDYVNNLRRSREYMAKKIGQMMLFAGLILLFFAVSVFMQVSDAARQIRSETRTIGTLRAVGADLKTLVSCYRLPVWLCVAVSLIPCLLFYVVTEIPELRVFKDNHPVIMIPALLIMGACVALACIAGIRGRLMGVTRQSIVDNIREL